MLRGFASQHCCLQDLLIVLYTQTTDNLRLLSNLLWVAALSVSLPHPATELVMTTAVLWNDFPLVEAHIGTS